MTEHQRLINKAKKIASMMQSPFENEVLVASSLLTKLLDEHNINLQELGIKCPDLNRTAKSDVTYTNPSTKITETDYDRIVEVVYKHPYHIMSDWMRDLIIKIAKAYWINTVVVTDNVRLIGYASNVEIVKLMIINLSGFINSRIFERGYTDNEYITSYAAGIVDRVAQKIMCCYPRNITCALAHKLSQYTSTHYGNNPRATFKDVCHVGTAYQVGLYDGDTFNYKKVA